MPLQGKKIGTFLVNLVIMFTFGGTAFLALEDSAAPITSATLATSAAPAVHLSSSNSCNNGGETSPPEAQDPTIDQSKGWEIRDIVDNLPKPPGESSDMQISDPFVLLAFYVTYREEKGLPVTADDIYPKFSGNVPSLARNLSYLTYENNWNTILNAYQERYSSP